MLGIEGRRGLGKIEGGKEMGSKEWGCEREVVGRLVASFPGSLGMSLCVRNTEHSGSTSQL